MVDLPYCLKNSFNYKLWQPKAKTKPAVRRGRKASTLSDAEADGLPIKAARFFLRGVSQRQLILVMNILSYGDLVMKKLGTHSYISWLKRHRGMGTISLKGQNQPFFGVKQGNGLKPCQAGNFNKIPIVGDMVVRPGAASERFPLPLKQKWGMIDERLTTPRFICRVDDEGPCQANISAASRISWAMANFCGQACSARE